MASRPEAYSSAGDERARVEAQFAVVIKEVAVFRQREKLGSVKNLAIGSVQQIVSEEFARIPDDDGFLTVCPQPREILAQVRMHDEKRR